VKEKHYGEVAQVFQVDSPYVEGREKVDIDEELPYEFCGVKWG
jgi:hypothetical protein